MAAYVSIADALRRGHRMVYGVGATLMFASFVPFVVILLFKEHLTNVPLWTELLAEFTVVLGVVAAWLAWSIQTPKWKLWAYANVQDVRALKQAAIQDQLIWSDNHLFEKTEICSRAMRQKILKLEGRL